MSALINHARVLGGVSILYLHLLVISLTSLLQFAVPYFQIEWALERGTHIVFGVEAAVVAGLFLVIVPLLQLKGKSLRKAFPPAVSH